MDYKHPFVLYLNLSVSVILLLLVLPTLLNKREALKVRIAFSLIFSTVIFTCIVNIFTLYLDNYKLLPAIFTGVFVPLLFGPLIFYYVKHLLGSTVTKGIYWSLLPGTLSFIYGVYLMFISDAQKAQVFQQVVSGGHLFFETINTFILVLTLFYCGKAWLYLRGLRFDKSGPLIVQQELKRKWAKEFISYFFYSVFAYLVLMMVIKNVFGVLQTELDLIMMPLFMLVLYLLISVRSMMMYKDFEFQYVVAKLESEKAIGAQRLEIAGDLHDSLGAQLTLMNSVLDGVKSGGYPLDEKLKTKLHTLAVFSENAVTELKNVLWVLHAEAVTLGDLRLKILNFLVQAAEAKDSIKIKTAFHVEDGVSITSKQAICLFRAVQEIANNALKHAGAKEISLTLQLEGSRLLLRISDDGTGFDVEEGRAKSFGLSNIENRIRELNGNLVLTSVEGRGTTYIIEVTL